MASRAACATSERAPPPMSQKSAALPPAASIWSMVLMTRPAPLPMTPMSPLSGTNARPAARALASRSSSGGSRHHVRVPEQRVVVDGHLAVQADELASGGEHQRVDLDQRRVAVAVQLPQPAADLGQRGADARAARLVRAELGGVHHVAHLVLEQARAGGRWGGAGSRRARASASSSMSTPPSRGEDEQRAAHLARDRDRRCTARARCRRPARPAAPRPRGRGWSWRGCPRPRPPPRRREPQTRMPPALPRPPVLACALTQTCGPSCSAARAPPAGVAATNDGSTGSPAAAKSLLPSCSSRSMRPSLRGLGGAREVASIASASSPSRRPRSNACSLSSLKRGGTRLSTASRTASTGSTSLTRASAPTATMLVTTFLPSSSVATCVNGRPQRTTVRSSGSTSTSPES